MYCILSISCETRYHYHVYWITWRRGRVLTLHSLWILFLIWSGSCFLVGLFYMLLIPIFYVASLRTAELSRCLAFRRSIIITWSSCPQAETVICTWSFCVKTNFFVVRVLLVLLLVLLVLLFYLLSHGHKDDVTLIPL